MNAEIISVGTELLLGEIVNSDAQMISEGLSILGINVYYHTVVGDNPERVKQAVAIAKDRADILITTGGLGPTCDDLTKETLAEAFSKKLIMHQPSLDRVIKAFQELNRPMTDSNKKQAMIPEGATVLENDWGTAPGCAFEQGGKHVIMLPGPPRECRPMFFEKAFPYLMKLSGGTIISESVKVFGLGESAMEDLLRDMMNTMSNPTVAPYAKEGECLARVTAKAENEEKAREMIEPVVKKVCDIIGEYVYGVNVNSLEEVVVRELSSKKLTLATAESCTGGLLSKRITDIAGSSACFVGGICAYTNEIKTKLLHVPAALLEEKGAVSPEVAAKMAEGVRQAMKTDYGIGITGVAGPDGGSDTKPVGLIYIALSNGKETKIKKWTTNRGRERNRLMAASSALDMLRLDLMQK
ncbi:MAG: competence/damage-inducible protein A [Clostridiales bacterium]|nr:competence/damage-inducible protein A [Clostridiales bacterium]